LILKPKDNLDHVVKYVIETLEGEKDSRPPEGPIAFAQQDAHGRWMIKAVVGRVPTSASKLAAEAHGAEVIIVEDAPQ
jgi:hypothetical protein